MHYQLPLKTMKFGFQSIVGSLVAVKCNNYFEDIFGVEYFDGFWQFVQVSVYC